MEKPACFPRCCWQWYRTAMLLLRPKGRLDPRCQVVSPPSVSRGRSSLDLGWL